MTEAEGFHSIGFPSEWGRTPSGWKSYYAQFAVHVSIQLVSPASGDLRLRAVKELTDLRVSIQLVSPASGDLRRNPTLQEIAAVSIQLVSPASGDNHSNSRSIALQWVNAISSFHSIGFPSEWGHPPIETQIWWEVQTAFARDRN